MLRFCLWWMIGCLYLATANATDIRGLFLGDSGPHQPRDRFAELQPVLAARGISLEYSEDVERLSREGLTKFDVLVVYANIDTIDDQPAAAILQFVAEGGGFVPLHCASFCFRNQPELVALIGAQFESHGTGVFQAQPADSDHPVMQGFGGFRSWDETYVHRLHNSTDRTVLEYRVDETGREPWTWVRTQGKGRVFYTASGHDTRTWTQPGFLNLVERGIRWAAGEDPTSAGPYQVDRPFIPSGMTAIDQAEAPFEYEDVGPKIPNYTPSKQWGTQGKPKTAMQSPLSPEDSIRRFVTPQGLSVARYADERDFDAKPIAMTWDEQGRLWICETVDYPNELGKNRDRIRICEDTDRDGVADQFTVFATGLSIPTSIVIVRGGAVVQNATETIYLKDTDGDDVADDRTTLITGWALGDTHGGVSNFRYGLDNWIWAMQGYNNSTPKIVGARENANDEAQSFRQGFWRFKLSQSDPPVVTDLEFVRSSDNNTWGLGISEEGLIFGSTANHNPSMFMPIANRYYERVRGWSPSTLHSIADTHEFDPITENIRQVDHHGGYTAAAGHALYTARAFPSQWWNRTSFVAGPTGHLIGTFVIRPEGSGFSSTSPLNLLASDDEWSAPVMAEVGPDGAVWVIDWYNYIVQHNPTPNGFDTGKGAAYESDLRDKRHGRIYRVVPDDASRLHRFDSLADADDATLVAALKHPSMRWRLHAQRLLVERQAAAKSMVRNTLIEFIRDPAVDEIGLNVAAIHALHVLADTDQTNSGPNFRLSEIAGEALRHASAGVRRAALAVMPRDASGLEQLMKQRDVFIDLHPQVRLQSALCLADMPPSDAAGELIADYSASESDSVLMDAWTSAAATHASGFLRAILTQHVHPQNGALPESNDLILRRVAEHVARGTPDDEQLGQLIAGMSTENNVASLAILDGLLAGLPRDFTLGDVSSMDSSLVTAFDQSPPPLQVKLLRLAARVGSDSLQPKAEAILSAIEERVSDTDASDEVRLAAAADLIGFGPNSLDAVESLSGYDHAANVPGSRRGNVASGQSKSASGSRRGDRRSDGGVSSKNQVGSVRRVAA